MVLDQALTKDQINAWGWRLPFLFSVVMALFGWWLRRSLHESEAGEKAKEIAMRPPVFSAIAADWKPSLQLFAIVAFSNALYYYVFNAAVISAKAADAANAAAFQTSNTVALMFVAVGKVLGGWMSDRLGRRGSALVFTLWGLAVMVPGWLAMTHMPIQPSAFLSAQLLMGIPIAMALGMQGAMLVEMFPVANRVVSMSFAYSVAMALSGGIMPMLDSWFTTELKRPGATMVWIGGLGLMATFVLLRMRDTTGRDLKT
jgi:MHS family proline/betaine transporter-like MFS transporter